MSFWEDSSPIIKGAIIVGVIGILYLGVDWKFGLFLFPGSCSYENPDVAGEMIDGCPAESTCTDDGDCVQQSRGL